MNSVDTRMHGALITKKKGGEKSCPTVEDRFPEVKLFCTVNDDVIRVQNS